MNPLNLFHQFLLLLFFNAIVGVVTLSNPGGIWDRKNDRKNPMIGKVKVIQGIRPGVIAFSRGHGHWAYGAGSAVFYDTKVKLIKV